MLHSVCEATAEHQVTPRSDFNSQEPTIKHKNALGSPRNNDKVSSTKMHYRKLSKQRHGVCKFVSLKRPVKFDILFFYYYYYCFAITPFCYM